MLAPVPYSAMDRLRGLQPGNVRPTPPSRFVVPNGLVGYWGLDPDCLDFTNNLAFDLSGNGNSGTLSNLPATALANGQVGTALTFGATSTFGAGSVASLNPDYVTVSAWANFSSFANSYNTVVASSIGGGANPYTLMARSTGKLALYVKNSALNVFNYDATGAFTLATGVWNHLALTFSVSKLIGYVNAQVDATVAVSGTLLTGGSFYIGYDPNNGNRHVNGPIDDVRIYNRALDPWEITALHRAGLAGRR